MSDDIENDENPFYLDGLQPLEDEQPRPELLAEIDWRAEVYEFDFYYACVMGEFETPSSSWVEVAYSRQLGGCFVVWFSGVSGLEAPEFCSYGWIECKDLKTDFDNAFLRRCLLQQAPVLGYHFNAEAYYASHSAH